MLFYCAFYCIRFLDAEYAFGELHETHPCRFDDGEACVVGDVVLRGKGVFHHVHRVGRQAPGLPPDVERDHRGPLHLCVRFKVVAVRDPFWAVLQRGEDNPLGEAILHRRAVNAV